MRGISYYLTVALVVISPITSIYGVVPWLEQDCLIRGGGRNPERGRVDERKGYSGIISDPKCKRRSNSKGTVSDSNLNWGGGKEWNERDYTDEEEDDDNGDEWVEHKDNNHGYDHEEDHDYMYDYGSPPMSVKEKLSVATESVGNRVSGAKHKAEKLYREAHTFLSSDMESVLLKATRPDNDPSKRKYCESVVEACSR